MPSSAPRSVRAVSHPAALCLAALATLGFPGCPEDVTGPGGGPGDPNSLTMSNCWPNDDGRWWLFETTLQPLEVEPFELLAANATVPEVSFGLARALLADEVAPVAGALQEYPFQLAFQGRITTESGVEAQNLTELVPVRGPNLRATGPMRSGSRFLASLAAARPDLRARIAALAPAAAPATDGGVAYWLPLFIHGYAWIKGPAWIGTYGDVDTLLAWKFLEATLRPGHTFRHQLVPSLASDVWLNARVERRLAVEVPGIGRVGNAIEVLYLLDYGVGYATDAMGNVVGSYRAFDYGTVTWAPGVGPVRDVERRLAYVGRQVTHGLYDIRLDLTSTGVSTLDRAAANRRP
ncbi:MAG: hypothetical protein IT347_08105 [Candidatus Eisenbacteria bacterium]|nr:hypothetical protein [Candidatus Eisenbacteria bacterium]